MISGYENQYDEADYKRYYTLFNYLKSAQVKADKREPEELADDEISAAEEGFMKGYEGRSYKDIEWT